MNRFSYPVLLLLLLLGSCSLQNNFYRQKYTSFSHGSSQHGMRDDQQRAVMHDAANESGQEDAVLNINSPLRDTAYGKIPEVIQPDLHRNEEWKDTAMSRNIQHAEISPSPGDPDIQNNISGLGFLSVLLAAASIVSMVMGVNPVGILILLGLTMIFLLLQTIWLNRFRKEKEAEENKTDDRLKSRIQVNLALVGVVILFAVFWLIFKI